MKCFCKDIENQTVYPLLVRYDGKSYLTLYYYTEQADSILHNAKHILYFRSVEEMQSFCVKSNLKMENEIAEYDLDSPIENPIDYTRILNNWNLLDTIAGTFGMFFEGNCKKYDSLYDLLFRLNTPVVPIPATYRVCEKDYNKLISIFRKKERFISLFKLYQG